MSSTSASRVHTKGRLQRLWWSSLPLRVIALTLATAVLVLVLGGILLLRQTANGVLAGKRTSALNESASALAQMQNQLSTVDLSTSTLYDQLNELADDAAAQPGQYLLIIEGPVAGYVSPGLDAATVPSGLADAVIHGNGLYLTPILVRYTDPSLDLPGVAVGGQLTVPATDLVVPVYFIFPEGHELQTLSVVRRAVLTTGAVLVLALAGIAYLMSRQVTRPVRQASRTAELIASGHLSERVKVHGSDDLASLATSLNDMASELQHQITQLEELSAVQQRFVSDVSHELRTPLTTVRMAAELLYENRSDFDPVAARSAELLQTELDRFASLLADLLEISRFDAGAALLTLEETNLVTLVADEIEAQRAFGDKMQTPIQLHAPALALAEVDARRVRRIVRNLITNAIEYGEHRPIDVTVAVNDAAIAVTVRDHGVGFRADQVDQVFHRFWRADPSRTRTVGGTGLGLAISREDALLHHATLDAWGRPGRGAQFRLTLPRRPDKPVVDSPLPRRPSDDPMLAGLFTPAAEDAVSGGAP